MKKPPQTFGFVGGFVFGRNKLANLWQFLQRILRGMKFTQ